MHRRAVEAFGEILGEQLPVRPHVRDDALADAQVLEAIASETCRRLERRWIFREADEHESAPGSGRHFEERKPAHVEVGRLHASRRGDELAGQVVGP